jgi:ATP-binding protein involved in chromosome partitioning
MPLPMIDEEKPALDATQAEQERIKRALSTIQHRIGIHAGKGGVGKTFLACNLALLLRSEGFEVGLLDADVDCPNVHEYFGVQHELEMDGAGRIIPFVHQGVKIVSTGFIQPPNEPLVIRGPIKHRVLLDFLERAAWGPLDYLIIDFPPGTSDVPLSAMQYANLTGLLLVTTPQREALADARRASAMARQLGVPILGLIENMSGEIFGSRETSFAKELSVPFLGSIPLDKKYRSVTEAGESVFLDESLNGLAKVLLNSLK